jgi:hypothetical protein
MIITDPENIGCGRKLEADVIEALASRVKALIPDCDIGGDFSSVACPPDQGKPGHPLICSIDRTIRFCDNEDVFVRAAVNHAANDVVVGLAPPSVVSASIGFTPADVHNERHFSIMDAFAKELKRLNAHVAKLHSFYDRDTNLTVGVLGWARCFAPAPTGSGAIYISKQMGALKEIYLSELGHTSLNLGAAYDSITASAVPMLPILGGLGLRATDVSGFGLLHAADQLLLRHGLRGELDLIKVPTVTDSVLKIEAECLQKGRSYSCRALDVRRETDQQIGHLSELNGPLIILVPHSQESAFVNEMLELFGSEPARLGEWRQ